MIQISRHVAAKVTQNVTLVLSLFTNNRLNSSGTLTFKTAQYQRERLRLSKIFQLHYSSTFRCQIFRQTTNNFVEY